MAKPKPARPRPPAPEPHIDSRTGLPMTHEREEEMRRELSERYDQLEIFLAQKRADAEERARIRRMQEAAAPD
ncbi:hypothetical protein [Brevundimonas sp. PAMC22021]|uniref:hypothetical protein n=1 Tax=Brevundimonas sp. PAMC22021 TaxID=2861285 RepID=UPI001C635E1D|nr:hypothetical protein [Brevundimonas sp. PAMC22021]QYF87131.1 hypothetical protein KY493_01005 [Brevundimonas sp. PAMC22021]